MSSLLPPPSPPSSPASSTLPPETTTATITNNPATTTTPFLHALIAGGLAGTSVDVALFPIDTLKTRLQAPQGFVKAGGFRGVYNGLGAAAIGSAPGAALFFCTYESLKPRVLEIQRRYGIDNEAVSHMTAASIGEAAACLVRVPTEVIKSKLQVAAGAAASAATLAKAEGMAASTATTATTTTATAPTMVATFRLVLQETHGGGLLTRLVGGLYRGYGITLLREIPFAMIQFPLYEQFKKSWSEQYKSNGAPVTAVEAAACGSVSGGIAAALTTPLDVVKTRLMLGQDQHGVPYRSAWDVIQRTHASAGTKVFWSGIQPRVMWISIGGFVFFGAYEAFKDVLVTILPQ